MTTLTAALERLDQDQAPAATAGIRTKRMTDRDGAVERQDPDEVVLLPLYPQYSKTTTGSSLNEWNRRWKRTGTPVTAIEEFYEDAAYLDSVIETECFRVGRGSSARRQPLR